MGKAALLAVIALLAPQVAAAHVVRHSSIPDAYLGTWAPAARACNEGDKSLIVLSAKGYVGPAGSCAVDSVSETVGTQGSIYSARLQCSAPGAQAQKKTTANLIIRPDKVDQVSLGPGFGSLKAYQRCPASEPAAKQ